MELFFRNTDIFLGFKKRVQGIPDQFPVQVFCMEKNQRFCPIDSFTHGRQFFNIQFPDLVYEGDQLSGQSLRYVRDTGSDDFSFEPLVGK